mgnify:CR=1 FL=1
MPLMQQQPSSPNDKDGDDEYNKVASDLIFESAKAFLLQPEATQHLMKSLQGAKDIGTAVGKMAALVVSRVTGEMKNADLDVGEEPVFGAEGGLTKVLTAIYVVANQNGMNLPMEESLVQAYEVAEADLEKLYAAQKSGNADIGAAPSPAVPPQQPPTGAPLMGGM